jgi:hypothetical protein
VVGVIALDRADAVAAFEDAYVERARRELGDRVAPAEAAVLDRQPLAGGGVALAGWWCPPGESNELVVLPNPWDERAAIADHDAYCWGLSEVVLDRLAAGLNEHHGARRGRPYWDLLLRPWLMYLLPAALDRRLYCLALSRLAPELPVAEGPPMPVPATMVDAVEVVRTDTGNQAFGSLIAGSLGLTLAPLPQRPAAAAGAPGGPHLSARVLTTLVHAADRATAMGTSRGGAVAVSGAFGLPRRDRLRLVRRVPDLRFAPVQRDTTVARAGAEQAGARARLGELPHGDERATALAAAACSLLPRTVVEDYPALCERSVSAYGPPCAVVAGNYGPHDAENEFLGRCAETGQPIAFAQHGGFYVQALVNGQERLERRPGSVFVSWGAEGEGVRPLPSPYLQRLRDRHRGGDRVVLIEWIVPPDPYLIRFAATPLGNQGFRQGSMLPEFVRSVNRLRDRLFLKRFPSFVAGGERDPAVAALPYQPPVLRRTAPGLMKAARLVVVTYPDTPFVEAMAIGAPTIGLWDPDLWELRKEARAPYDALRDAGVVFSDPRAAAAQMERVYDRASEWWASADIQDARRGFLDRFAIAGDWLPEWSAFLSELGADTT